MPFDLATDKDGNVYVADERGRSGAIYKYDPNGTRLSELTAGFSNTGIGAIAVDKANGVVYFTTPNVSPGFWRSDPNSQIPNKPEPFGFPSWTPTSLAVDNAGNVYASAGRPLDKFDRKGNWVTRVGYASKVLGVDRQDSVYYRSDDGKTLMRATQSAGCYTSKEVPTSGACDAMAIDDGDNLYIADKKEGTIRKYRPDRTEFVLIGHYGDLRAFAVAGKQLYIANGCDGILKVEADSGKCAGTRLFQLAKPYDYFVKIENGAYYLSGCYYNGDYVDQYDGNDKGDVTNYAKGNGAKGLALDRFNALAYTMDDRLIWKEEGYETKSYVYDKMEGVAYLFDPNDYELFARDRFFVALSGENKIIALGKHCWHLDNLQQRGEVVSGVAGLRGLAVCETKYIYWVSNKDGVGVIGRATFVTNNSPYLNDSYNDVNKKFITELDNPEAVAVDKYNWVYATNSPEAQEKRRIGRYSPAGTLLSELYADGMRNRGTDFTYLRGLIADPDGREITVLQRCGDFCEVWIYSNIFAN